MNSLRSLKTEFRVNPKLRRFWKLRKGRIERRLEKKGKLNPRVPAFTARNIHYEFSGRVQAIAHGGIGAFHLLAQRIGLIDAIDSRLHLLKFHLPYHESDHVLNFAYNVLCDGDCLQDIELRRNDEGFLDAIGAQRIPDPTTAGDFCRRFKADDVSNLIDIFNEVRKTVWARQPAEFFDLARIDMDGVLVETLGECKAGMNIAYDGTWGYHPLIVSLANTQEVLSIINRPGNRPSYDGAAAEVDRAVKVCFDGGFHKVRLRGDTDFSQTKHLDRWTDDIRVSFIFGLDCTANRHFLADELPSMAWQPFVRPPKYEIKTVPRRKPERVKEKVVREREFENIVLQSEDVAEIQYRPTACHKTYRLVVVRKNLSIEKGEEVLFPDYRYFFYLTNDWESTPTAIVLEANQRCNQENLNAQLQSGIRALYAPVDTLESNWAYMVMTSLAWNLKAWWALWPIETPRHRERHREEKRIVLGMEFKTFAAAFVRMPCQIVRTGGRLIYRLLSWNRWQPLFFRTFAQLRC